MTDGIKHKKIYGHGEKGLAVDWNDIHEITGDFDVEKHQALNFAIENRDDFPAGPEVGQVIYRTDLNTLYIFNGTAWIFFVNRTILEDYVAIPVGIYYWSCSGSGFKGNNSGETYTLTGVRYNCTSAQSVDAPVYLPHGATITSCIVYGSNAAKIWYLKRGAIADGNATSTLATANINTEDNTIAGPTVDNTLYTYAISTNELADGDDIDGVRITYTL